MSTKALLALTLLCLFTTSVGTGCDAPPSDSNTGSQKTKYLTIRAVRGQDVVLPCRVHKDYPIAAVAWRRIDVKPAEVLLYQSKTSHQASKYPPRSRMHLMDRRMKNGNLSSALQNVTLPESGAYECLAVDTEMHQWKTPIENADTIIIIQLIIDPEAPPLNAGERRFAPPTSLLLFLILGLLTGLMFLFLCLILMMLKHRPLT